MHFAIKSIVKLTLKILITAAKAIAFSGNIGIPVIIRNYLKHFVFCKKLFSLLSETVFSECQQLLQVKGGSHSSLVSVE